MTRRDPGEEVKMEDDSVVAGAKRKLAALEAEVETMKKALSAKKLEAKELREALQRIGVAVEPEPASERGAAGPGHVVVGA